MQPCTPTGDALSRVGYDGQGNRPAAELVARAPGLRGTMSFCCRADRIRRHDDAEQLGGRCPLPASDAGADRAHARPRPSGVGCRRRAAAMVESTPRVPKRPIRPTPPGSSRAVDLAVAVDVDPVGGEPGGEPGVLPLPADRERELEVGHDDLDLAGRPASTTSLEITWAGDSALPT